MRYRAIQLPEVQNDQFAQVELIDLVTAGQEDEPHKIEYQQKVLELQTVPEPVRSHVAFVLSGLLGNKFDKQGQKAMIAKAIALNPLNPEVAAGALRRDAN